MIVLKRPDGKFEKIEGNPTLTSADGSTRAPLKTVMHPSWSAAERAKFNIFDVNAAEVEVLGAKGKKRTDGTWKAEIEAIKKRLDELEKFK